MFVGPPIHVNGRLYVGASPGTPTGEQCKGGPLSSLGTDYSGVDA